MPGARRRRRMAAGGGGGGGGGAGCTVAGAGARRRTGLAAVVEAAVAPGVPSRGPAPPAVAVAAVPDAPWSAPVRTSSSAVAAAVAATVSPCSAAADRCGGGSGPGFTDAGRPTGMRRRWRRGPRFHEGIRGRWWRRRRPARSGIAAVPGAAPRLRVRRAPDGILLQAVRRAAPPCVTAVGSETRSCRSRRRSAGCARRRPAEFDAARRPHESGHGGTGGSRQEKRSRGGGGGGSTANSRGRGGRKNSGGRGGGA